MTIYYKTPTNYYNISLLMHETTLPSNTLFKIVSDYKRIKGTVQTSNGLDGSKVTQSV